MGNVCCNDSNGGKDLHLMEEKAGGGKPIKMDPKVFDEYL
jgi:hypothetical protein